MNQKLNENQVKTLSTWLWLLFWIVVPNLIAGLLSGDPASHSLSGLSSVGEMLNVLCFLAYGMILLKLGTVQRRYRISGICALVGGGINAVLGILGLTVSLPGSALIFTLASAAIGIVGEWYEYTAHATVLEERSPILAEKWLSLRKWYIIIYLSVFVGVAVTLLIPIVGAVIMMVTSLGVIVISILKLVYLYRTAKIFRS